MKLNKIAAIAFGCVALMASSCQNNSGKVTVNKQLNSQTDTIAYSLGNSFGNRMLEQMKQFPIGNADSMLSKEAIIKGFVDAINKDTIFNEDTLRKATDRCFKALIEEQSEKLKAEFAKVAAEYEARGFKDLGLPNNPRLSGYKGATVRMLVEEEGKGDSIKESDIIYLDYEGKLADNGKVFDSSFDRGEAAFFSPAQVIPGFSQGLLQLKEGSKAQILIPSDLAYGTRGAGENIPANSTLLFKVDIKKVLHTEAEAKKFFEQVQKEKEKNAKK